MLPSYDALLAGAGSGGITFVGKEAMEGLGGRTFAGEKKVGRDRKKKLQEWDRLLKDFRYGDALDSVLRKVRPPLSMYAL
jgi:U3 small nucleolar RNA-associated protein 15